MRFQPYKATFSALYNAAIHEIISKHLSEPSWKVSKSKIWIETATKLLSKLTNLQCDNEEEFVTSDVYSTRSRNFQNKDIVSGFSVDGERSEENKEYLFRPADGVLIVCRHANRKLARSFPGCFPGRSWHRRTTELSFIISRVARTW